MAEDEYSHWAVLLEEAVTALVTDEEGFYIDGTFGRGGHSRRILDRLSDRGRLLAFDKDPEAVELGRELARRDSRFSVEHGSFAELRTRAESLGVAGAVAGVLLDLGVSSPQLDDAGRGFSFTNDGPLDMRMNTAEGMTAGQWLAQASEREIADVLHHYGEERFSRRMARALVAARRERKITTTLELAEIIKQANPAWEKSKHPATRAFQAIRIFINNELEDLEKTLPDVVEVLAPGGRMVVISFHSLEDRMVKRFIQHRARGDDFPPDLPVTAAQLNPTLKPVGKAVRSGTDEIADNIRARSAVMRVAEKLG